MCIGVCLQFYVCIGVGISSKYVCMCICMSALCAYMCMYALYMFRCIQHTCMCACLHTYDPLYPATLSIYVPNSIRRFSMAPFEPIGLACAGWAARRWWRGEAGD